MGTPSEDEIKFFTNQLDEFEKNINSLIADWKTIIETSKCNV